MLDPIPVLNAASALIIVKLIKDGKEINTAHKSLNPFESTGTFTFSSENENITLSSFDYVASVKSTTGVYEEFTSGSENNSNSITLSNISSNQTNYKITGSNARFIHDASKVTFSKSYSYSYEFLVPKVMALTSDKDTLDRIVNVSLDITTEDGSFPLTSGATNINGSSRLYLTPGKYTIIAKADGYIDLTSSFTFKDTDLEFDVILELESNINNPGPNSGAAGDNLEPITPFTNSETSTIPNIPSVPNVSSLTITEESGFEGVIDQGLG